jgi:hypothetical protein
MHVIDSQVRKSQARGRSVVWPLALVGSLRCALVYLDHHQQAHTLDEKTTKLQGQEQCANAAQPLSTASAVRTSVHTVAHITALLTHNP